MKYILKKDCALRSWVDFPRCIVSRNYYKGIDVEEETFNILKKCDGIQDVELNDVCKTLLEKGILKEATANEELLEWQKYKSYDCKFTPTIYFRVTGICNLNCLHCFNAKDINKDFSCWTYEEFKKLIVEAKEIGLISFEITGGEPLTNPDFMKIVREIYANDMVVSSIITNGHFLTQDILDELKSLGCETIFRISFDSIGHHDWIRQQEGAEKIALEAIKLCVKNGFKVVVNMQANQITKDTILESAEVLESIGVEVLRIIKTTEAPRWRDYSKEANFTIKEYFDFCVDFLRNYYRKERKMDIILWSFGKFHSSQKKYSFEAVRCNLKDYRDSYISCPTQRYKIAIGSNGTLYPCHQASGAYDEAGIKFPNVKEIGLKKAILDETYIKNTHTTAGDVIKVSKECRECIHFRQCLGGCRALTLMHNINGSGPDYTKCEFFNGNYAEKVANVLPSDFNTKKIAKDASYFTGDMEVLNNCDVE